MTPGAAGTPTGTAGSVIAGASGIGGASVTGESGAQAGVAGSTAVASGGTPASGSAGAAAGAPSGSTAGSAAGTAGMDSSAAGTMGSAGTAGGDSVDVTQCLADVMAAGTTITDCERCLCQPDNCQQVLAPLKGDAKANAVVNCSKANMCSGQCCLCATNGMGAMCAMDGSNFATGKCANEIEDAAGVAAGADLVTAATAVGMYCTDMATDTTNPCTKATLLAKCASDKCATQCPSAACTM